MTQEPEPVDVRPPPPPLKVTAPKVNEDHPWSDDVLQRKQIADRLTTIVREQDQPFVTSVDGGWGTGKTFLLRRWQQDLKNQEWQAIYYNAWEDDFSDDPLLAILARLQESLEKGKFRSLVEKIVEAGRPLLRPAASIALAATTGVPLPGPSSSTPPEDRFGDYRWKKEKKDELKQLLRQMAEEVAEETSQPLVFIIDELDRCRPTFAIELLERVKHIFDVPNIVFVFGINREELVKALESIYGEIDAGTYLRRFFDMEFILPEADPASFCQHLVQKFQLGPLFEGLTRLARTDTHLREFREISEDLPRVLGSIGFSLRDMDYCVRLLSLAAKDLPQRYTLYPEMFVLLVAVKIGDPGLYRRVIQREARGAELIDYLNEHRTVETSDPSYHESQEEHVFSCIEAAAYAADDAQATLAQLELVQAGQELTQPQYLASRTSALDPTDEVDARRLESLTELIGHYGSLRRGYNASLRFLPEKIDIYSGMTRR